MTAVSDLFERVMASKNGSNDYAIFGADGALWKNDVVEAVLARMAKDYPHEYRSDLGRYRSLVGSGAGRAAYELSARIFQGWTQNDVECIACKVLCKGIAVNKNIVLLMRRLRVCRVSIYVVSASPEPIVKAALECCGIADTVDRVIGVRNRAIRGVLSGLLEHPIPVYEEKVMCVRKFIHPTVPPLLVVGDGANDEKLLRMGIHRAVVNRGSAFTKKARKLGWAILEP